MAEQTASPVRTMTAGVAAQVVLLVALTMAAGLGPAGWLAGIAFATVGVAALTVGLRRFGARSFGPADLVTMTRAILAGGVTALVVDTTPGPVPVTPLVVLAAVALATDAVDGRVARRTGTVSAFGARFDMEVDAFLILVLSAYLATTLGPWVLAIGLMRYAFVAAGRVLPWLRADLPHSMIRKTVAAAQGIVLTVAAADLLPHVASVVLTGLALAALTWSFGYDLGWLHRHRETAQAAVALAVAPAATRSRKRRVLAGVTTALACVLVLFALVGPNQLGRLTPQAFARIPLEALLVAALVLVLPTRTRRVAVCVVGVGLGLLTIMKFVDMGFYETLDRPFNPVFDWSFFGPGVDFLAESVGGFGAIAAVVGAVLLVGAILVLMTLAILRLTRIAVGHRTTATRTVALVGVVWVVCAALGVQVGPKAPVASNAAANDVFDEVRQVRSDLLDPQRFAEEAAVDHFRNIRGDQLLTGLRGKDVVLNFVESYGRVAIEDPAIAPGVDAVLDAGTKRLRAAGFDARSAFLTSSTFGGGSWFAHSTLQSGLWINNQQRYDSLVVTDRLTLTGAFKRAGWRTVGTAPQINKDWPEGDYFGYEKQYGANNVGYRGPQFTYSKMPDQYTLSYFQRTELAPADRAPVMAEIDLTSSHSPWAPLPTMVDWKNVGDGSVFDPMPAAGRSPDEFWPNPAPVRKEYGKSIEYSLESLISYVETYGNDNTVLIFLGDHQPAPMVSGSGASRDVPITIVARDPAVLDRISGWGWEPGLNPTPHAPVTRMDTFRDRFLTAFGPSGAAPRHQASPKPR
ncbi:CDP-alcohol phosphatidyltransferase family protein [Actinophytocola sp.]|uniref:CDP-alcohol phosphatidyltransferase family protein n=1 Tax=Actinophytocola sp. TaxID=1872138 RepID=UPI002ED9587E